MDTDKVIQDLNRRFAAPLPEFYQRRIIFWYDEDKEFEDKLDEVVLENAKVIALTGNNAFSVKKLLTVDDLTTNYLVWTVLQRKNIFLNLVENFRLLENILINTIQKKKTYQGCHSYKEVHFR